MPDKLLQKQIKKCPSCQENKAIDAFYKSSKDGLQSRCKLCQKLKHVSYSSEYSKLYYQATSGRDKVRRKRSNYRALWTQYFKIRYGANPTCQVCDVALRWPDETNEKQVVHFDHRNHGHESWQGSPVNFFSNRPCIDENIRVWEECDFGVLCIKCNGSLPTKNRLDWLSRAVEYAKVN